MMTKRKPCLAEEWFVEDNIDNMDSFPLWHLFADTHEKALREIYKQSRSIRVSNILAGRGDADIDDHRRAHDVLLMLGGFVKTALHIIDEQKMRRVHDD